MESPSGLATNIYRLGIAASVPWISYTWTTRDDPSADSLGLERLQLAELATRRGGDFSYLDQRRCCLWVFESPLNHPDRDQLHVRFEENLQLAESFGLQEVHRGVLISHDRNPSGERSNGTNIYGKRERNDDAVAEFVKSNTIVAAAKNRQLIASSTLGIDAKNAIELGKPLQTDLLYAIQSSCILELEKSLHFIGLGSGLFCSIDHTAFSQNSKIDIKTPNEPSPERALWSLEVAWHNTGAILVSYNQIASNVVSTPPEDIETNVVLAPFGWTARTLPIRLQNGVDQESRGDRLGFGHTWRSQCVKLLREHGLETQNYLNWIVVQTNSTIGADISGQIEWPHPLCLTVRLPRKHVHQEPQQMNGDKPWTDPLQEIAKWMGDTKNRETLVKQQLSIKSRTGNTQLAKVAGEEEVLAHLQSRYEESLDAQAIAGIYPTPPDVNKSHGQIHAELNSSLLGQTGESSSEAAAANGGASGGPQIAQDENADTDDYDPFKGDDLFNDMDASMDGDNGVTEDDFRFFDEPDELDDPAPILESPVTLEQVVQESPAAISNNDQQELFEVVQDPEIEAEVEQQANMAETTSLAVASPAIITNAVLETATAEAKQAKVPQSNANSQGFDAKYSALGKYAWGKIQRPTTTTPYTRIEQDKGIPLIRETVLTSPSTANSPSSESFNEVDYAQTSSQDDVEETHLFTEQGRLLSKLTIGCSTFTVDNNPNIISETIRKDLPMLVYSREGGYHGQISIQLAQVAADQSVFYDFLEGEHDQDSSSKKLYSTADLVANMLQRQFPTSQALNLLQCTQLETELNEDEESRASFDVLSPPMVRVKRADTVLDISYPALKFWKELSLKPLHDLKDVLAICLCQEGDAHRAGALSFLQSMEDAYRSLKLGNHTAGHPNLKSYAQGVVPVPGMTTPLANGKVLSAFCSQLGKSLSTLGMMRETIIVYIIKPSEDGVSLITLCVLFHKIFESYASMFRKPDRPTDLVLQVIPPFMAAAGMSRIFSSLKHCGTISRIIYDRCPVANSSSSVYASASIAQLAQPLPTSIDFKLTTDNSLNPMATRETFHLAYAYTEGSSWLSAALIDSFGSKQWTASYFLGEVSKRQLVLAAVMNEIWDIMWLAAGYRRTYDVVMVKTTRWTIEEINLWKNLAQGSKISLKLLAYDTSCPIKVNNSDSDSRANIDALESELVAVPPTPDVSSPDATGGKADEQDTTTRLVDARNQAWWATSKEILTMDDGLLIVQEHSGSGYFVHGNNKVTGFYVVDSTHAVDIAAIAEAFQGLRILAQVRCVHEHLPWHIAMAQGAQSGLERHLSNYKIV